jgi:hypothetical protein
MEPKTPKQILKKKKIYYKKNKKRIDKYQKKYREKNRKKIRAQQKEYNKNRRKLTPARIKWLKKNREKLRQYHKEYRKKNKKILQKKKLEHLYRVKEEVLDHFGRKCNCCGETQYEFLTIDHINGRDKSEPRITGKKLWLKVKSENYPKNKYQLLCFNCNCAKGIYGSCPHKGIKGGRKDGRI